MTSFTIIVAVETVRNGIGNKGDLPWKIGEDMRRFRDLTLDTRSGKPNALLMGHTTWKSLKGNAFKDRINVVLSRNTESVKYDSDTPERFHVCSSLDEALEKVRNTADEIFVIGGAELYRDALAHPCLRRILLTSITCGDPIEIDTIMPTIDWRKFRHVHSICREEKNYKLEFQNWVRIHPNLEEQQYLDLVRYVLNQCESRPDRTGVGVLTSFGHKMTFDLSSQFPLLTTKRVFFRGVVEELLWFLRGNTDAGLLKQKGVHIWDGNASREYLDSIGLLHNDENDLGPIYGFQWRHFGAEYEKSDSDYSNKGVDQITNLIHQITSTPNDRRMILNAWNPVDLKKMALPPCHILSQFYVDNGYLSCQMYQRSCDLGLGVPFNIASYALLTYILSHVCNLKPGKLIHIMGDTHIYKTHVSGLHEQIKRIPSRFPTLKICVPECRTDWSKWSFQNFQLENYNPQEKIQMEMAV